MHDLAVSTVSVGTFSRPVSSGRPLKFTPERIQQIQNLVERGTGRDEIAALIGVTVGSRLQSPALGHKLIIPHPDSR